MDTVLILTSYFTVKLQQKYMYIAKGYSYQSSFGKYIMWVLSKYFALCDVAKISLIPQVM